MLRLTALLEIAARHVWYRSCHGGPRLAVWPVVTKAELYTRLEATRRDSAGRIGVYFSRSGGTTTNRPLYFPTDIAENHEQRNRLARCLGAADVLSPRTIAINICPVARMYRALEIFNEFCDCCGATVLPMTDIATDEEVCEQAFLFGANSLIGMPSRLVMLGRYAQENRRAWQVDTVLFGGEFLQPGKRRFLQEVCGVKRFSGVYGSAELGVVAWQPDLPAVPVYRFPRDIAHVEIVTPDTDGFGTLVATNLVRRRFPIVRYDTGDVGRIVAEDSESVHIELQGRRSDSFLIGDNYHALADLADIFQDFAEFQIQIHFDEAQRRDVIRLCLVPGDMTLTDEARRTIAGRFRERLQEDDALYRTEVAFVGGESLVRSAGRLKTPAIVDRRGR